ncbi:MAG: DUF3187 family protein [Gemmatimonadota bacterium]|nr:DUF3187 family protein [Gemmatimonadota bacterium]
MSRSPVQPPSARARARGVLWVVAGLLGLFTSASRAAGQAPALGPLTSEDGAPLHRLGLTAPAESPDPVGTGSLRWGSWMAFSNVFEQEAGAEHVLLIDMERLVTTAQVRYGVTRDLEIGGRLTFETTGGGNLDPFLTWWHTFLRVGNANRERFRDGAYHQTVEMEGGETVLDVPRRIFGLEDIRLFGKWRLAGSEDAPATLSLRLTTRIPTAGGPFVQENTDLDVSALGRVSRADWHGHAMLGASTVRATSDADVRMFQARSYHALLGIERSLGDGWAAVVQYQMSSPLLRSFEHRELDGPSFNLTFGVAGTLDDTWRWDVSFQEDLPTDTPAADFTLGVRLSRAW